MGTTVFKEDDESSTWVWAEDWVLDGATIEFIIEYQEVKGLDLSKVLPESGLDLFKVFGGVGVLATEPGYGWSVSLAVGGDLMVRKVFELSRPTLAVLKPGKAPDDARAAALRALQPFVSGLRAFVGGL